MAQAGPPQTDPFAVGASLAEKSGATGAEGAEAAEGDPGCCPEQQEMLQPNKDFPAASSSAGSLEFWEGLRDLGGKSTVSEEPPASCEGTQQPLEEPTGETEVSPIGGSLPVFSPPGGPLPGLSREKVHQGHRGAASTLSAGGYWSGRFATTFKEGGQHNAAWAAKTCLAGPCTSSAAGDEALAATVALQLGRLSQRGGRGVSEPASPRVQFPGGQRSDLLDAARRAGDCSPPPNPVASDTRLVRGCAGAPSEHQFAACSGAGPSGDTDIPDASLPAASRIPQALSEAAHRGNDAQRALAAAAAWGAIATTGERGGGAAEAVSQFFSMCGDIDEFESDRSASGGGSGGQPVDVADSAATPPCAGNLDSHGGGELGTKEATEEHKFSATGEVDETA